MIQHVLLRRSPSSFRTPRRLFPNDTLKRKQLKFWCFQMCFQVSIYLKVPRDKASTRRGATPTDWSDKKHRSIDETLFCETWDPPRYESSNLVYISSCVRMSKGILLELFPHFLERLEIHQPSKKVTRHISDRILSTGNVSVHIPGLLVARKTLENLSSLFGNKVWLHLQKCQTMQISGCCQLAPTHAETVLGSCFFSGPNHFHRFTYSYDLTWQHPGTLIIDHL